MKEKMKIKPILGTEKSFKMINKRIETGISTKNKSGKTFSLTEDIIATRISYQNIIDSIPAQPGLLIITGHSKNSQITLEVLKSASNIKSAFSKSQRNMRFRTLINYLKNQSFDYIEIQLAQAC
jgi:hypothetical protein